MKLNLKEFFNIGNKATVTPVAEDDNTGLTMSVGNDEETFDDEEETDDWNKPETDDAAEFEKEPTTKDV